jgi:hypothetical protein
MFGQFSESLCCYQVSSVMCVNISLYRSSVQEQLFLLVICDRFTLCTTLTVVATESWECKLDHHLQRWDFIQINPTGHQRLRVIWFENTFRI